MVSAVNAKLNWATEKWKFWFWINDCDAKMNEVINVELNAFKFVLKLLEVYNTGAETELRLI